MKDVRKPFGTFWSSQFLQGVIIEDFEEKHRFPGPLETILRQFTAQLSILPRENFKTIEADLGSSSPFDA